MLVTVIIFVAAKERKVRQGCHARQYLESR